MAEKATRLTAKFVESGRVKAGSYSDGDNLYLRVGAGGSKSWVFRWKPKGGAVSELGLGSFAKRGLKDARDKAAELRAAIAKGERDKEQLKAIVNPLPVVETLPTFKVYAERLIAEKKADPAYRSKKHLEQWTSTLTTYAYPTIGDKRPGDISIADLLEILKPLWATKTETATRLRQRIQDVIDYGFAKEDDDRANPARWGGRLATLLGKPNKDVQHHRAVPYDDLPAVMAKLRTKDSISAAILRFSILTAARSSEARGAFWSEFDLAKQVWAIPASRMKGKKQGHRVPLNPEAMDILAAMAARRAEGQELVFAGERGGKLSDVAVAKALRLAYPRASDAGAHYTPHGTARSSFRDWAAEQTDYRSEVVEWALAHIQGKVIKSYQRNDLLLKRVALMQSWHDYLNK